MFLKCLWEWWVKQLVLFWMKLGYIARTYHANKIVKTYQNNYRVGWNGSIWEAKSIRRFPFKFGFYQSISENLDQ